MGIKRSRRDSVSSSEDPSTPLSREQSVDVKIVHLDASSAVSDKPAVMRCSLPPHQTLTFASFEEYDVHYQKTHMNRCSECQKNFPDEHFLHLHIAENHDPINAAKRDRGEKTYACLISDCDRFCSTPQKRRLHCIDKHLFPRDYDFFVVNDGIDRRSSMLRHPHRRRSSTLSSAQGSISVPNRRRGESIASTVGQSVEVTKDEAKGGEAHAEGEDGDDQEDEARREPFKLRGRGGFGHPQAGRGRGRGRGASAATYPSKPAPTAGTSSSADPVDGLTTSMSALQFIPHSVLLARGRGRGRA